MKFEYGVGEAYMELDKLWVEIDGAYIGFRWSIGGA